MAKARPINLLPQEEFEASVLGRILRWAMGTFRIIVILTEMVVMGAFLSRFWLDAQNSDLSQQIKIASAEISAQADFEKEFRAVQAKLKIFKEIKQNVKSSDRFNLLATKIPADVIFTSVSLNPTSSEIKGNSASENGIAQLISNLKADPVFKQVDLESLGSSDNNSAITTFSIKLLYK